MCFGHSVLCYDVDKSVHFKRSSCEMCVCVCVFIGGWGGAGWCIVGGGWQPTTDAHDAHSLGPRGHRGTG